MSNLIKRLVGNIATRIMLIFYLTIIFLSSFFIIFGYFNQLSLQEEKQHEKLRAIVSSVVSALDGDEHEQMMIDHANIDDISVAESNITYLEIHEILAKVAEKNDLNFPIYTLVYEEENNVFEFGVTSEKEPYFRHEYTKFPQILLDNIDIGGIIPSYKSENGIWLSAFEPLKNSQGETVALIEADIEFSYFISEVRKQYGYQALIALVVIILVALILIPRTRKILKQEEELKNQFQAQNEIIKEKNKSITDSINYALKIQSAILPSLSKFSDLLKENFVFYKPKDIVAGDFYFLEKFNGDIYVAVADCTGHGVPGAMVSVICSNALGYVIHDSKITSPGKILDEVTEIVTKKFESSPDGIKDGMDICLCKINLKERKLEYAGANNALYFIRESSKEIECIPPNKQPIGQFDYRVPFVTHELNLEKNDIIYLFTDGFADQFGGENGKKLKSKLFKDLLWKLQENGKDLHNQGYFLDNFFEDWKGNNEQVDDVCVIGIRF